MKPNQHKSLEIMFFTCPIMDSHATVQPILKLDPDEAMKTRVVKIKFQTEIDLLLLATDMRTENLKELSLCVKYCPYFYICYKEYLRIKQKPVKGKAKGNQLPKQRKVSPKTLKLYWRKINM